jgi:hypothetical protein
MWYAVTEILIFLLIALILGGVAGFLLAQSPTLRIGRWKARRPSGDQTSKQLSAARAEITHLQRLVAETDAGVGTTGTRLSKRVAKATGTATEDEVPDVEAV